MDLVKIDRNSIKKNPNAGNTQTRIALGSECTLQIKNHLIPGFLVDGENDCFLQKWNDVESIFKIYNRDIVDKLVELGIKNKYSKELFYINIEHKNQVFNHFPESKYFYYYENTLVECDNCHQKIAIKNVIEEYGDEGEHYFQCPICKEIDTFEIEYEKIEDVIKE